MGGLRLALHSEDAIKHKIKQSFNSQESVITASTDGE
jgi:hypothetical protein